MKSDENLWNKLISLQNELSQLRDEIKIKRTSTHDSSNTTSTNLYTLNTIDYLKRYNLLNDDADNTFGADLQNNNGNKWL